MLTAGAGAYAWSGQAATLRRARLLAASQGSYAAQGTAGASADTLIATGDLHIGPESSAITLAGTPAANDLVYFRLKRDVSNDTLAADARLIGIKLVLNFTSANDA